MMSGIDITAFPGNPFANPLWWDSLEPRLVIGFHEDDWRRVDSTSLVVCRHCGQVKPLTGWSGQCWRMVRPANHSRAEATR